MFGKEAQRLGASHFQKKYHDGTEHPSALGNAAGHGQDVQVRGQNASGAGSVESNSEGQGFPSLGTTDTRSIRARVQGRDTAPGV
jgi:hypothetical protein